MLSRPSTQRGLMDDEFAHNGNDSVHENNSSLNRYTYNRCTEQLTVWEECARDIQPKRCRTTSLHQNGGAFKFFQVAERSCCRALVGFLILPNLYLPQNVPTRRILHHLATGRTFNIGIQNQRRSTDGAAHPDRRPDISKRAEALINDYKVHAAMRLIAAKADETTRRRRRHSTR